MKPLIPEPTLLTVDDVAERLQVCTRTVGRMMRAGTFPVVKVGRCTRIPLSALEAYISANTY